jgi:hypothetical protein
MVGYYINGMVDVLIEFLLCGIQGSCMFPGSGQFGRERKMLVEQAFVCSFTVTKTSNDFIVFSLRLLRPVFYGTRTTELGIDSFRVIPLTDPVPADSMENHPRKR